ncbi:hypothetical protein [Dyadobacter arcticus]|uniref:Uncharacterized protein n=1 Tax=Dyadobacter arcticus TaxID=1078754 RepID=A0ABX0UH82_9BACT|nr:hypothetical protein [Dyadobacter arcticus]NIJ52272.1 hypothetical protein [Dyadobacter arcticus]
MAVTVPILAGLLVWKQRGFSGGVFEYGKLTILEGELIRTPVPFLRIPVKQTVGNVPLFERILLIGYNKRGADSTLNQWEAKRGTLANKTLTVRGTLIYHDGKAALELTEENDALLRVSALKESDVPTHNMARFQLSPSASPVNLGMVTLSGEITDPKCMLGVMKPGEGRPHRSCAVRCIAGGIPPLLSVRNGTDHANYYLIVEPDGQPLNASILKDVGRPVQLSGRLEKADNWLILYTDSVRALAKTKLDEGSQIAMCR